MTTQNNQTDIFSMFGLKDEFAEKQKRLAEERKRKMEEIKKNKESVPNGIAGKEKVKKDTTEELIVDLETVIRYLGEEIIITEYFSPEEILEGVSDKGSDKKRKIKGEDIRKRIEKDFPELVAAYTEIVHLKKKNLIIPVTKMKKKGVDCNQQKEAPRASFSKLKKVPYSLLIQFVAIAKRFAEENVEVHGDIYLDMDKDLLFLDIPPQRATRYNVDLTSEAVYIIAERLADLRVKKVMEIHSHHVFEAIPSSQDNISETGPFLYAIVGKINQLFPDISVRRFDQKREVYVQLEASQIFESPFDQTTLNEYDLSVIEVVK